MDYRNDSTARCCAESGAARSGIIAECADDDMAFVPVMVYIIGQDWRCVYPEEQALNRGTLFPALDKPLYRNGGCAGCSPANSRSARVPEGKGGSCCD